MLKLRELRLRANLSQQNVADTLGISQQAYANYEAGKREPNNEALSKLSDLFNVTTDYLLGKTDIKSPPAPEGFDPMDVDMREIIEKIKKARNDGTTLFVAGYGQNGTRVETVTEEESAAAFAFIQAMRKNREEKKDK